MRIDHARYNTMPTTYDTSAPKKPTNLTVNSDLLRIAKALKINVSATLEHALQIKSASSNDKFGWRRISRGLTTTISLLSTTALFLMV